MSAVLLSSASPAEAAPTKAPSGLERSQGFVTEGDEAMEREDYREAIAKYNAAYYGLDTSERVSYMGSLPVRKAMRAYERLAAQEPREHVKAVLEAQLALVTNFLTSVRSLPSSAELVDAEVLTELEAVRVRVEEEINALSPEMPPPETNGTETDGTETDETETDGIQTPVDTPPSNPASPRQRKLGIGLAVGGAAGVVAGGVAMVGWWTVPPQAERYANTTPGYEEGTDARASYLEREDGRKLQYLVSGAVIAGIGAAIATTGVVLVVKHRRRPSDRAAWQVAPALGPSRAGLMVAGRF